MGSEAPVSHALRIACMSLLPTPGPGQGHVVLPHGDVFWDLIPVPQSLEYIRDYIPSLLDQYDGVALEGISSKFRIGGKWFPHEYIESFLELSALGERFSDGSLLRSTLERHLVRLAADELKPLVSSKTILFFSGLNRYGSAEVLSAYSRHLLFGDLLYGFRLGIPIASFRAFVRSAPQLAQAVGKTPAHWFWPSARRSHRVMPRFSYYFRRADVIVGGISYFMRYSPRRLDGKLVFTNLMREEDLELFDERGAAVVVSLTPVIGDSFVPLAVLEAAFKLRTEKRHAAKIEDHFLNCLHELDLKPRIYDLRPIPQSTPTAEALHQVAQQAVVTPPPAPVKLTPGSDVAKFCFVIHPLSFTQVKRLKVVRALSNFVPHRLIEDAVAQLPPLLVGAVRGINGAEGSKAEGLIYAVPMTSRAIMRFPPEFMYRKLLAIAGEAAKQGCQIMGLGAYTSIVGDAGVTVSEQSPLAVTTGNSFSVAATIRGLEQAASRAGLDLSQCRALVVGATGSIGSICARLLAPRVAELYLVSPRPERLLALSRKLESEKPSVRQRLRLSRHVSDFAGLADVVIATTSSVEPVVDVMDLKPGCVVCDVARPPDIRPQAAAARTDVLVIESGEIKLPQGAEVTYDIGLPRGLIYACLAETALLALERYFKHFTLGREIEPEKVHLIQAFADRHGFELAPPSSFGRVVPPERFTRLQAINRKRS